jgi:hypothetical protein
MVQVCCIMTNICYRLCARDCVDEGHHAFGKGAGAWYGSSLTHVKHVPCFPQNALVQHGLLYCSSFAMRCSCIPYLESNDAKR